MMKGALPPSSSDNFLTVLADWEIKTFPVRVEPVKEIFRIKVCSHMIRPISGAFVREHVMMFMAPGGRPAIAASWASASAEYGVSSAGFAMNVQPEARAAAALRANM